MSNIEKFKSPKGLLEWVTITGEGKENMSGKMQYVANVVVEADDPVVQKIKDYWEANKPAGFKKDAKSLGIYPHMVPTDQKDEEGKTIYEEDGKLYLAFKTGTTFPDGKHKKVQVYNAKAKKVELPEGTMIGNGTIGIIAGAMGIYVSKTPKGAITAAGVTLYLDAIQITKLVEYSADAGFAAEDEDGWSGDEGWDGEGVTDEASAEESSSAAKPRL
jgi:hypothetical protein